MPVPSIPSSFSIHKPIPLRLLSIEPGTDEETVRFILTQNKQIREHNQKALDAWKAGKRRQEEGQAEKVANGPQNRRRRPRKKTAQADAEQAYYKLPRHKLYTTSRVEIPSSGEPRQEWVETSDLPPSDRAIACDECHKEGGFLAKSCRPRPSYIQGSSCMNCCLRHRICRWYGELEYHSGLVALHEGQERPCPQRMEIVLRTREENKLTRVNHTVIPSNDIVRRLKKIILDTRQLLSSFEDLLESPER